ncbi:MAG TPA: helix-hairpin-helix domain-containing protein [Acidobacteriota bacterium]|nr:helix-hairpin-helix domain-containing protein [Acidobacteriota bacterium]
MSHAAREAVIRELTTIPGVGPSIAVDLWNIGIRGIEDLKGADPEDLWLKINSHQGQITCRCVLYTMRCAVYYASHEEHNPELLKWWHHKD